MKGAGRGGVGYGIVDGKAVRSGLILVLQMLSGWTLYGPQCPRNGFVQSSSDVKLGNELDVLQCTL